MQGRDGTERTSVLIRVVAVHPPTHRRARQSVSPCRWVASTRRRSRRPWRGTEQHPCGSAGRMARTRQAPLSRRGNAARRGFFARRAYFFSTKTLKKRCCGVTSVHWASESEAFSSERHPGPRQVPRRARRHPRRATHAGRFPRRSRGRLTTSKIRSDLILEVCRYDTIGHFQCTIRCSTRETHKAESKSVRTVLDTNVVMRPSIFCQKMRL